MTQPQTRVPRSKVRLQLETWKSYTGGGLATDPRAGGGGGGLAPAVVVLAADPAFFELWYICVNRSSAMCPVSIDTLTIRLRKKALKKMAGTEMAMPRKVIDNAAEMPRDSSAGLGVVPAPSDMNAWIMPNTVPTSPISGPSVPITAV